MGNEEIPTGMHYLLVNRGKYLCSDHGAFCDSSDGYLKECPLCCSDSKTLKWKPNNVDRVLQLINGLQGRSKRNLAIVSGLIGGAGLLRFIGGIYLPKDVEIPPIINMASLFSASFLIASVALYASSMRQVSVTEGGMIPTKSVAMWEKELAKKLSGLEALHRYAGVALMAGIVFIGAVLVLLAKITLLQLCNP